MAIVTLKFESETVEQEDKTAEPKYSRNDVLALWVMLGSIDIKKYRPREWRTYLGVEEKVSERNKAKDFDCEIQFTVAEASFLEKFLENPTEKLLQGVSLNSFHLRTWRNLSDQFVAEIPEEEKVTKLNK